MSPHLITWLSLFLAITIPCRAEEVAKDGEFEREPSKSSNALRPEVWGRFSSKEPMQLKIEKDPLHKGRQVLRMESHGESGSYQGIFQTVPVVGGGKYKFSVQVLNDKRTPLAKGSAGVLSVEWVDAEGGELSREESEEWRSTLSSSAWKEQMLEAKAPEGATQARFVVLQRDREEADGSFGGAFYVDDYSIYEKEP